MIPTEQEIAEALHVIGSAIGQLNGGSTQDRLYAAFDDLTEELLRGEDLETVLDKVHS